MNFHSLPKSIQQFFQPKGKDSLTIHAYKEYGEWYFNKFPITWQEQLCFPKVLDKLSGGKNKISLKITTYEVEGAEKIWYLQDDPWYPEASEYVWKDETIWLCPWLQWYFGHKPENMWWEIVGEA